jgi:L-threonylcarbamoyladenylate synthase
MILQANKENIAKAAEIIRAGRLVAFPTETVYGLGADALNPIAVSRIFEAKKRPFFDPLIVHIDSINSLEKVTFSVGKTEQRLAEKFWPGPLTIVFPKQKNIPDIVTAGLQTVAVRMPSDKTALELIRAACTPIAAPSANLFGHISPTIAEHVEEQLGKEVEVILDGGKSSVGVESTIVMIENDNVVILRHGGISLEEIEDITGKINLSAKNTVNPAVPGQLPSHYSPQTPLVLVDSIAGIDTKGMNTGFITFRKPKHMHSDDCIQILSESGDMREAAANLFSCMHNLDKMNLDIIYAEKIPEYGLGRAIMDRLTRAAKK